MKRQSSWKMPKNGFSLLLAKFGLIGGIVAMGASSLFAQSANNPYPNVRVFPGHLGSVWSCPRSLQSQIESDLQQGRFSLGDIGSNCYTVHTVPAAALPAWHAQIRRAHPRLGDAEFRRLARNPYCRKLQAPGTSPDSCQMVLSSIRTRRMLSTATATGNGDRPNPWAGLTSAPVPSVPDSANGLFPDYSGLGPSGTGVPFGAPPNATR